MSGLIKGIRQGRHSAKAGQAMTEFIIVAAMLLVALAIFSLLMVTFNENGDRVISLTASEYP